MDPKENVRAIALRTFKAYNPGEHPLGWHYWKRAFDIAGTEIDKICDTRDLLEEALLQLKYLSDKFGETGTGNSVISRIESHLKTK